MIAAISIAYCICQMNSSFLAAERYNDGLKVECAKTSFVLTSTDKGLSINNKSLDKQLDDCQYNHARICEDY